MAFNLMCESREKINWNSLNERAQSLKLIEVVPMPNLSVSNGDALGISVPLKNVGEQAFRELTEFLKYLLENYKFRIYDLYSNKLLTAENIWELRKQIV